MPLKLDAQSIDIETVIINAIARYVRDNLLSQESSGSSNSSEAPGADVFNENNEHKNRFLVTDVGFFDSFYDNKFNDIEAEMKHAEKKTYFRNMLIFINRIKNIIKMKDVKLFRNNLQIYLRNETLK